MSESAFSVDSGSAAWFTRKAASSNTAARVTSVWLRIAAGLPTRARMNGPASRALVLWGPRERPAQPGSRGRRVFEALPDPTGPPVQADCRPQGPVGPAGALGPAGP